jgi:hypothetical protein
LLSVRSQANFAFPATSPHTPDLHQKLRPSLTALRVSSHSRTATTQLEISVRSRGTRIGKLDRAARFHSGSFNLRRGLELRAFTKADSLGTTFVTLFNCWPCWAKVYS